MPFHGGLHVDVVEQCAPERIIVQVSATEPNTFAADLGDRHGLIFGWVPQATRPYAHPVREDISVEKRVAELAPVGATPAQRVKLCDGQGILFNCWSEANHASIVQEQTEPGAGVAW